MKDFTHIRPIKTAKGIKPGLMLAVILISVTLTSCVSDYGYNGRPGRAYMALSWDVDVPDFIDAGTGDIPPVFEWGQYYRTYSGLYMVYYEGRYWNGYRHVWYAWEMDYEIYAIAGQPGGYGYNGANGPDTYFDIVCTPYGPELYDNIAYKKSITATPGNTEDTKDNGSIETIKNGFGIKLTFRKTEPRYGEKTAKPESTR